MAETDLSAWWTVDETAGRIGCSKRTVERLGRAKQLEQRLRRQEGTPPVAVYSPEDVARIALERRREAPPFVLPAVSTSTNGNGHGQSAALAKPHFENAVSGEALIRGLAVLLSKSLQSPPSPPVAERRGGEAALFLTLSEASAISGLSQAYLKRAIEDKSLPAIRDRGWRIRRKDLESL